MPSNDAMHEVIANNAEKFYPSITQQWMLIMKTR
jgi:hypothetical protein